MAILQMPTGVGPLFSPSVQTAVSKEAAPFQQGQFAPGTLAQAQNQMQMSGMQGMTPAMSDPRGPAMGLQPTLGLGVLGGPGTGGFTGGLFVPDTSRPKSEDQLQAEWMRLQESARKTRAEGFMGQVVLPGEGSYEDWKQLNQYELMRNPDAPDSLYANFDMTGMGDSNKGQETNSMADQNTISTSADLQTAIQKEASKGVPSLSAVTISPTAGEDIGAVSLGGIDQAPTYQATETGLTQPVPVAPTGLGQVSGIAETMPGLTELGGMEAAQLAPTGPYVQMAGVEGVASPESMAIAAQAELDPRATVQYQLGELMSSLEEGKPMPAWASPQVRKINAIMQSRGLGASSMASAAIVQSLMESGVQIAAADANKYAAIQLQNLDNRQKAALQNAATVAAMDRANLSARLQGAVTEAQSLLSVDLKNLDNKQKSDTLNYSVLVQGLFKDAAEENARQQFNAKNELQVEEFFAELGSQIETINANRNAAMRQFNVSEANAMTQFNKQMQDSRDKFNANMQFAIDQSNAVWRRELNTINTATQNETNRIKVQNQYAATQNALNNLWQQYRDNAAWNFQKSENALNRQHETATIAMQLANQRDILNDQQKQDLADNLGKWLGQIALEVVD